MAAMTDPNEIEQNRLTAEATGLEKSIEMLEQRVLALTDEHTEKRRLAQEAYRNRFAKTFADVDTAMALVGYPVEHKIAVASITFGVRPPNGEVARRVDLFAMDPIEKSAEKADKTDLGPVSVGERRLLGWLSSTTAISKDGRVETKDLSTLDYARKLKVIRSLLEPVAAKLAERCAELDAYLSVVLELDSGN
jgi:hypothetical protein